MSGGRGSALEAEFKSIARAHHSATRKFTARSSLPPSVTRVFHTGTKDALVERLARLPVDELPTLEDEAAFRHWFDCQLDDVAITICRLNPPNVTPRIHPGYKWGHGTKVLALFVRDLVIFSRYFSDADVERISPWLCCPIDGVVISRLRALGERPGVGLINQIDSAGRFWGIQDRLEVAAAEVGVPRVWFDDNWGDRDRGGA